MAIQESAIVRGRDGLVGTVDASGLVALEGGGVVEVRLDDGRALRVPADLLLPQQDGSYALAFSASEVAALDAPAGDEEVVIPVVAEEVEVGRRRVETGKVRVRKTVRTTEQVVDEPVFREEVEVERIKIDRVIDAPVGPRQEGDVLIVPLLEEVLVVEKRLILREEIRITRRRSEHRDAQTVTLRSEEATVERIEGETPVDPLG